MCVICVLGVKMTRYVERRSKHRRGGGGLKRGAGKGL